MASSMASMVSPQTPNEHRQRETIEAAMDPNSNVSAKDAQQSIVSESKKAGVTAFTFDPDASYHEKMAQARAAVPEGFYHEKQTNGIVVVTDATGSSSPVVPNLPPPSKIGVVEAVAEARSADAKSGLPNSHAAVEPADPFSGTGWGPRFGWPSDDALAAESLLDNPDWLGSNLPDHFYGDWYHNAAVIVFACIASWVVAVLGGGLSWVLIIMAICSTYYRTSLRRVRRNFRDDITRELASKKIETDSESVEWINAFMLKFWPIYQPVLAQTVINSVDQVLSGSTPTFLESLKLRTFTLGSKAPRMEHVRTIKADDDVVIMDWMFSFTPNDTADMTAKQITNKINPKIVLEIRIGKAMLSKGLDVIVEDMAFSGLMRLKIKLQIPWPHVEKVEMCFLERPKIDYVCKPLGGDTFGFDINFIPGLEKFILEQIHATLEPMMYQPNVFPIEIAKMLAGTPVDQAIGVVAVTLHGANGLKTGDNFGSTVDAYAAVTLNRRQPPLAKTKIIKDNPNPRWAETHYIIISSFADTLNVEIFDYNEYRKTRCLGFASFALEHLEQLNTYTNERLEIISDGKARGVLSCDIRFFPVLEGKKMPDGKVEPPPETNQGILRFTVEQAKDLDGTKSLIGLLNPYANLLLNGHIVHTTKRLKRTNNPIWDNGSKEMLIFDRRQAKLGVAIKDERDLAGDQDLGAKQIKLDDLIVNSQEGKDWYFLDGQSTGRIKVIVQWKPIAIGDILNGTGGYITPIGIMRFHFIKAMDLRNFETVGKSDPYVRVLLSGIERGRTVTFQNNLNPDWDEVLYVPIHSSKERLTLDVMDSEKLNKDRSLGLVEVFAGDYVRLHENGEYLAHDEKAVREDSLRLLGRGMPKGVLVYTVAFYPCLNIADPPGEDEEEAIEEQRFEVEDDGDQPDSVDALGLNAEEAASQSPTAGRFEVNRVNGVPHMNGANGVPQTSMVTPPKSPVLPVSAAVIQTLPKSPTKGNAESALQTAAGGAPSSALTVGKALADKASSGPPMLHLTPQELLKHDCGLVLVRLMEAELPRANCHIEIFVDDMAFPSYVSSVPKTRTHKFDEIGDCFIRELEWSNLTLKVREKSSDRGQDSTKDNTIAFMSGETLATLKQCLNNPTTLKLKARDDEGKPCTVRVSLKYLPVKMVLDPSESINNMGNLRVEIMDGQNLPSADSNGLSDPFCKFELNGLEVFKTKVIKKTLNPTWNEYFEVPIPSRTSAKFRLEAWDWDLASNPDFLGASPISLGHLEPFIRSEVKLSLDGQSGTVRLRLLFTPSYIKRTRQGTSTLGGTFSAPVKIATMAPGKLSQGVGKGTTFLKRPFREKEEVVNGTTSPRAENDELPLRSPVSLAMASPAPNGTGAGLPAIDLHQPELTVETGSNDPIQDGSHSRTRSFGAASVHSSPGGGSPHVGTAEFTVVQASGYPPAADLFVHIAQSAPKSKQVGKTKDHKAVSGSARFDESFKFACSPQAQFQVSVRGRHKFSMDDDLGSALYFVDDSGSGQDRGISVGQGTVTIRSSFTPAPSSAHFSGLLPAHSGMDPNSPDSNKSSLRRSLLNMNRGSRDSTPS